jgi:hypothetical protein
VLSSVESMSHPQSGVCNTGNDDQVTYSTPYRWPNKHMQRSAHSALLHSRPLMLFVRLMTIDASSRKGG